MINFLDKIHHIRIIYIRILILVILKNQFKSFKLFKNNQINKIFLKMFSTLIQYKLIIIYIYILIININEYIQIYIFKYIYLIQYK